MFDDVEVGLVIEIEFGIFDVVIYDLNFDVIYYVNCKVVVIVLEKDLGEFNNLLVINENCFCE